jgi:hypothetical protein
MGESPLREGERESGASWYVSLRQSPRLPDKIVDSCRPGELEDPPSGVYTV